VHSNRLSCKIDAPNASSSSTIALPGNAFDGPPPESLGLSTSDASFLYIMDLWFTWRHELMMLMVALPTLAVAVAVIAQGQHAEAGGSLAERLQSSWDALVAFICFRPGSLKTAAARSLSHMQVLCRNLLAMWSMLAVVVLLPTYVSAAGFYECGAVWLRGTLAYVAGNSTAEWCISVAACLFASCGTVALSELQRHEHHHKAEPRAAPDHEPQNRNTWQNKGWLLLAWLPIISVLSSPMVLYVLSLSLPPNENTLDLGPSFLLFFKYGIGVLLFGIKSLILPTLANYVANLVYGEDGVPPNTTARLMVDATAVIAVFAPVVTLMLVNQDCGAAWLQLWRPCSVPGQFSHSLDQIVSTFQYYAPCTSWIQCFEDDSGTLLQYYSADIYVNTTITSHQQICHPAYVSDGRCPRALIGSLGDLYAKELLAGAGIAPIITLLRATPQVQQMKAWVVRKVFRRSHYEPCTSVNRLLFGVVLNLELPLLLGFCYPVVAVLACLAVGLNAGVLYTASTYLGLKLSSESPTRMPIRYLWASFALGGALVMWLFVECDWYGKWLVLFGMPGCALVSRTCWWIWSRQSGPQEFCDSLSEPLLVDDTLETL